MLRQAQVHHQFGMVVTQYHHNQHQIISQIIIPTAKNTINDEKHIATI